MTADPSRRSLPVALWPEPDRQAWKEMLEAPAWARPHAAVRWSDATCERVADGYARWLGFVTRFEGLAELGPAARVTRKTLSDFVELLRTQVRPITIACYLEDLIDALKVLAPEFDRAWIRPVLASIRQQVRPDPGKRARVRDIRDLWDLGIYLMGLPERSGYSGPVLEAIDYRDGLLIALLAALPTRLGNHAAIVVGKHLVQIGTDWCLLFAATETKQRRELELPLPPALVPYLRQYLDIYRPRLGYTGAIPYLWIGREGRPMSKGSIGGVVTIRTRAAFGTHVNPHLFRSCAATTLALRDPEHVYAAAPLLGHSALDVTYKHYIQAKNVSAVRAYQDALGEWLTDTFETRPPK